MWHKHNVKTFQFPYFNQNVVFTLSMVVSCWEPNLEAYPALYVTSLTSSFKLEPPFHASWWNFLCKLNKIESYQRLSFFFPFVFLRKLECWCFLRNHLVSLDELIDKLAWKICQALEHYVHRSSVTQHPTHSLRRHDPWSGREIWIKIENWNFANTFSLGVCTAMMSGLIWLFAWINFSWIMLVSIFNLTPLPDFPHFQPTRCRDAIGRYGCHQHHWKCKFQFKIFHENFKNRILVTI